MRTKTPTFFYFFSLSLVFVLMCKGASAQMIQTYFDEKKQTLETAYQAQIKGGDTLKEGTYIKYFEYSEGIYEQGAYQNDKKHGLFITYFENGQKHWVRSYQNGFLFGDEAYYNAYGELEFNGFYELNAPHCTYTQRYPLGEIKKTTTLLHNQTNGKEISFYRSGDTSAVLSFQNGILEGDFAVYSPDHILQQQGKYHQGQLTGRILSYYPSGPIRSDGIFERGVPNGKMLDYYPNGQLKRDCSYKNDTLQGASTTYYQTGELWSRAMFYQGFFDKTYTEYYQNGQIKDSVTYMRSAKHGESKHYAQDGALLSREQFKLGLYHGHILSYYPSGQVKKDFNYSNGKKTGKNYSYFENGEVESVLIFDKSDQIIQELVFFENGDPASMTKHRYKEETSLDHQKVLNHYATLTTYHPNGKPSQKGTLLNEKKHGVWLSYYPTRKKKTVSPYKFDRLHGEYIAYHPNKQKSIVGKYAANKKEGVWQYFNQDGKLQKEIMFKKDQMNGFYMERLADGSVLIGQFNKGLKDGTWVESKEGKKVNISSYSNGKLIEKDSE